MKRAGWGLVVAAIAVVVWWWWGRPLHPAGPAAQVPLDRTALARSSTSSSPPTRERGRLGEPRRIGPPGRAATATGAADEGSLLDQLIAIRAIDSQIEVSAALERNAALAEEYDDRFCEESARFRPRSPLVPSAKQRDAAEFLAPRVDWATKPMRRGTLHLPDATIAALEGAADQWPRAISDAELAGLDFDWLAELGRFDHWSLLGAGPLAEAERSARLEEGLPYYLPLLQWAKLRFAAALRRGDVPQAAAEIRHLAKLVHSQDILLAQMIALALLRIEARGLEVAGLPAPGREDLERERLIRRYAGQFFFPGVAPEVMQKAAGCAQGACGALFEGAWMTSQVGDYASEDTSSTLWRLIDEAGCDRALLAEVEASFAITTAEQARELLFEDPPALLRAFGSR